MLKNSFKKIIILFGLHGCTKDLNQNSMIPEKISEYQINIETGNEAFDPKKLYLKNYFSKILEDKKFKQLNLHKENIEVHCPQCEKNIKIKKIPFISSYQYSKIEEENGFTFSIKNTVSKITQRVIEITSNSPPRKKIFQDVNCNFKYVFKNLSYKVYCEDCAKYFNYPFNPEKKTSEDYLLLYIPGLNKKSIFNYQEIEILEEKFILDSVFLKNAEDDFINPYRLTKLSEFIPSLFLYKKISKMEFSYEPLEREHSFLKNPLNEKKSLKESSSIINYGLNFKNNNTIYEIILKIFPPPGVKKYIEKKLGISLINEPNIYFYCESLSGEDVKINFLKKEQVRENSFGYNFFCKSYKSKSELDKSNIDTSLLKAFLIMRYIMDITILGKNSKNLNILDKQIIISDGQYLYVIKFSIHNSNFYIDLKKFNETLDTNFVSLCTFNSENIYNYAQETGYEKVMRCFKKSICCCCY